MITYLMTRSGSTRDWKILNHMSFRDFDYDMVMELIPMLSKIGRDDDDDVGESSPWWWAAASATQRILELNKPVPLHVRRGLLEDLRMSQAAFDDPDMGGMAYDEFEVLVLQYVLARSIYNVPMARYYVALLCDLMEEVIIGEELAAKKEKGKVGAVKVATKPKVASAPVTVKDEPRVPPTERPKHPAVNKVPTAAE